MITKAESICPLNNIGVFGDRRDNSLAWSKPCLKVHSLQGWFVPYQAKLNTFLLWGDQLTTVTNKTQFQSEVGPRATQVQPQMDI